MQTPPAGFDTLRTIAVSRIYGLPIGTASAGCLVS